MIRGVDVSHYQDDLDMARVKAKGGSFAIIKASQDTFSDASFRKLLAGTKATGMIAGAYHFLIQPEHGGGQSASAQADAFVRTVKAANGGTLDGLLLALDVEPYKTSTPSWGDVRTWVSRFRKLAGNDRALFIYTRSGVWGSYGNPNMRAALGSRTYLWLADWTVAAGSGWRRGFGGLKATIHQAGPFPALRPRIVDGNAFAGTPAQLRAYTRPKVAVPAPPPEPPPAPDPPAPPMVDRWSLPLLGARLRLAPDLEPVVVAAYGVPLLVEPGPIGPGAAADGSPLPPLLVVRSLAGLRLDPPLLVDPADLASSDPTSQASLPSSTMPSRG